MLSTEEEEELTSSKLSTEGEECKRGGAGSVVAGNDGTTCNVGGAWSLCKCKGRMAPTSRFHMPFEATSRAGLLFDFRERRRSSIKATFRMLTLFFFFFLFFSTDSSTLTFWLLLFLSSLVCRGKPSSVSEEDTVITPMGCSAFNSTRMEEEFFFFFFPFFGFLKFDLMWLPLPCKMQGETGEEI